MPSTILRPVPLQANSRWTMDDVRSALDNHESGDFSSSAVLVEAMGRDDRIFPALSTRLHAFTSKTGGLPFCVEPNEEGDKRRNKSIAEDLEEIWWDVVPESTLARLLRDGVMLGVAVGQVERTLVEGRWRPRLHALPAHNLRWDDNKHQWVYRVENGEIVVTPGEDGWFLYTPSGPLDPWMAGAVRALGQAFVMKQFTDRDWARYCERHGMPIIVIREPANSSKEGRAAFYQQMKTLSSSGVIRAPRVGEGEAEGWDFEFLEPTDQAWKTFEAFLSRLDRAITIVLLGQDGTTQQSNSSGYAQAKVHDRIRGDYLGGDAETLSTALRDQLVKPWGRLNVPNWNDRLAPWPKWNVEPPEDLKSSADVLNVLSNALKTLMEKNIPIDIEEIAEKFSLPLRAEGRVPEPEAPDPDDPNALPAPPLAPGLPGQPVAKQLPAAPQPNAAPRTP